MIRVVLFLIAVAMVAAGFVWFADRPGDVVITWMGYRAETSLMVAALAVAALILVVMFVWAIIRGILRSPEQVSLFFRHRRAMKGYLAISRGLIAIGAGDMRLARKSADEAARLSPGEPLALLLAAQSAQMAGDRGAAEHAFRAMSTRADTKLLGLRGLYIEAQRRNDATTARQVAQEALKSAPSLTWAGQAVLDDYCAATDWTGALNALEHMKSGLDKADYRRKRAVLLTARAQALEENDRDASRAAVLEAVKFAPNLVPAAALAGRRLAENGEMRKAGKILTAAWRANPHPDIAEAYANLRFGDTARARLTRMQTLAEKTPGQLEAALAVAHAALDAQEFAVARAALAPYLSAPTQRVATLMAQIEDTEQSDAGRSREWMARAMRASGDPVWTADGVVSDRWLPVSPNGRLDGYQWKLPLAELGFDRPVIEFTEEPAAAPVEPPMAEVTVEPSLIPASEPQPEPAPEPPRKSTKTVKPKPVELIIPLVHAPDDPGLDSGRLDSELDRDPIPEPTIPPRDAWTRLRQLFR